MNPEREDNSLEPFPAFTDPKPSVVTNACETDLGLLGRVSKPSLFTLSNFDPTKLGSNKSPLYEPYLLATCDWFNPDSRTYTQDSKPKLLNDNDSHAQALAVVARAADMLKHNHETLDHDHKKDMRSLILDAFTKNFSTDPNTNEESKVFTGSWAPGFESETPARRSLGDATAGIRMSVSELIEQIIDLSKKHFEASAEWKDGFTGTVTLHGDDGANQTLWYRRDDATKETLEMTKQNVEKATAMPMPRKGQTASSSDTNDAE